MSSKRKNMKKHLTVGLAHSRSLSQMSGFGKNMKPKHLEIRSSKKRRKQRSNSKVKLERWCWQGVRTSCIFVWCDYPYNILRKKKSMEEFDTRRHHLEKWKDEKDMGPVKIVESLMLFIRFHQDIAFVEEAPDTVGLDADSPGSMPITHTQSSLKLRTVCEDFELPKRFVQFHDLDIALHLLALRFHTTPKCQWNKWQWNKEARTCKNKQMCFFKFLSFFLSCLKRTSFYETNCYCNFQALMLRRFGACDTAWSNRWDLSSYSS